ncbi:MAG: TlpA family protein disulfide reductase [Gammaproteobacteria bacterium]|nr:TlpA family protein disulfide reductase [Gammaproteobacteria bacterium]
MHAPGFVGFSVLLLMISWFPTTNAGSDNAPEFNLPGVENTISLNQYRGKVVYLDFWASWCVPCRESFPWMNAMQNKYHDKGLAVVTVNLDKERALADKFLKEVPAAFVIGFDPEGSTAESYGLMGMPSSFIINRSGQIVYRHVGFRKENADKLEQELVKQLSSK